MLSSLLAEAEDATRRSRPPARLPARFVADARGSTVPRGAEVLSINGDSAEHVVSTLLDHVSGDADIVTGKYARIADDFATYYAVFFGRPRAYLVHLRDLAGKKISATV